MRVAHLPWDALYLTMPVVSYTGVPGLITGLHTDTRDHCISFRWANGHTSVGVHYQCDMVTTTDRLYWAGRLLWLLRVLIVRRPGFRLLT